MRSKSPLVAAAENGHFELCNKFISDWNILKSTAKVFENLLFSVVKVQRKEKELWVTIKRVLCTCF